LRWDEVQQERVLSTLRIPVLALQATGRGPEGKRRLLATGESSPYLDMVRSVARTVRVVIVPEAGHFVHLEAPAEVNAALEAFIASVTPGGSRFGSANTEDDHE
jgi:pimeloyl-ACP methyl ester carboxylesterase